jgi:flagellar biosynthesis/type III secretory pathway chaperone
MEKTLSSLMEIVEQEAELLELLCDLLYRQKSAAIKGDLEQLNQITQAQSLAYSKIAELELRRREIIAPLAEELELDPEAITLKILKDKFIPDNKLQWERILSLVKPLVSKIRRATKLNQKILKRCLILGEQRLQIFYDHRHQNQIYDSGGKKSKAGKNSGVVLNKKV